MTIEDLSKTQLLLLTILVNFVTAIATAVLTVSLLDQAPPYVTQTVNQIVERTVETVATGTPIASIVLPKPIPAAPQPTQEEKLTSALGADASRTVLIYKGSTTTPAIAYGTYLPKTRAVVTATVAGLPKEAVVEFPGGAVAPASVSKVGATLTIYGFSDDAALADAPTPGIVATGDLKQGQTVAAIGRDGSAQIAILAKVDADGIHAALAGIPPGGSLVSSAGDIIGIASPTSGLFIPAERILTLLSDPDAAP